MTTITATTAVDTINNGPVTPQMVKDFVVGCTKISDEYMTQRFPRLPKPVFEARTGQRYVKIVRLDSAVQQHGSVHAFIDLTNGDVLKPASFKAPAKHARGNLFDDKKGLGSMGPYGPAYLR